MLRPEPTLTWPFAAEVLMSMMLGRPLLPKLVPVTTPNLSPALPSRPCHWKPKSAESVGATSTIMLSM